ncbi:MAG: hypothetical protein OMM_01772 [Candidatus Magnetoglobus multicellularis str. Araruama]|uniref:Right handed beta helix domain-containing protein n=1 Tax=Candidatus Magnetoglobus multicellularis str. Araruama TaxID=890399 RepID=A0A1V1PC65_9BACT|nr:MAG: hypothetical protein OMM_01772 [Candidatus Magnetoglobus multicellularis str. Araruama]
MRKESIITFVIFLCVYSNALANAIYVDKGGGKDCTSISAALQSAYSGQTIVVAGGIYSESLSIKKNVILMGSGPDVTYIQANGNGIEIEPNLEVTIIGFYITASLTGIDFINDDSSDHGNGIIKNCVIANCGSRGIDVAKFKYGNVLIQNNTIVMNEDEAIYMYGQFGNSIAITIMGNIIAFNNDDGIHRHYHAGSAYQIPNLSISYNNVYNNSGNDYDRCESLSGGISQDPMFVDINSNYSLKSGSPCIDSGPIGVVYNDPDNTRNNMGAFGGPDAPVVNQAPNVPSNPQPANNSNGVSLLPTLSWNGTDPDSNDTLVYDIYMGTTSTPSKVSSNQGNSNYNPGELQKDVTYFWKIVVKDNHDNETVGPIWQFSTSTSEVCYSQEELNQAIATLFSQQQLNDAVAQAEAAKDLIISQLFTQEQLDNAVSQLETAKDLIISQKDQIIANKDQTIASLFTQEQLNDAIEGIKTTKDLIISQKDQIIASKDQIIASMFTQQELNNAVTEIEASKNLVISHKDQIIANKDQVIASLFTQEQLNTAVSQAELAKDLVISELEDTINSISTGYTVTLTKGWHLMSAINTPAIPKTEPEGAVNIMFEYQNGAYVPITVCQPGRGFWVKINQECVFKMYKIKM